MRLFVAIELPGEVRERVGDVCRRMREAGADVRWAEEGNWHVTVKFLGEVAEERVGEVLARVERAAREVAAFSLEVEGIGRLPEKGPARVIVSRVISPDQRITKLHRLVDSAMGGMGLPMDTRVLLPHVTLGRVTSNRGMNRLLRMVEKHDLDFFGEFAVERVVLFRSELGAGVDGGARYGVVGAGKIGARIEGVDGGATGI